jgi:hypothetical protein
MENTTPQVQAQEAVKKAAFPKKLVLITALGLLLGAASAQASFMYLRQEMEVTRVTLPALKPPVAQPAEAPAPVTPAVPEPASSPVPSPQWEGTSSVPGSAARPRPELTLQGIVYAGDGSYALINEEIVREKDKCFGCTVVKITRQKVELMCSGEPVVLSSTR